MTNKTIKISEENYKWLLNLASEIQKKKSRLISFDEALKSLRIGVDNGDIMELAGSWKISKEKADEIILNIYKERKVVSRRI